MIKGPSNEALNEQHQYCPVTLISWCKYQVDQINDTSFYNQQNCLPTVFRSALHYIFKGLSTDSLLQGCQRGLTQNQNESLNNMVWDRCPKRVLCGISRLQISVCEAVITFNSGAYARKQVLIISAWLLPGIMLQHLKTKIKNALEMQIERYCKNIKGVFTN